jgi:XTP/dITP diphosphohydrolase
VSTPTEQPIVIATGNPGKVREIAGIFSGHPRVRVVGLADVAADLPEPIEDGQTFEANAQIKALHYAGLTGRTCLADDSGLEVDALEGVPGVLSARYAETAFADGPFPDRASRDAGNNRRLLEVLGAVPVERRGARFVCAMCLVSPAGGPGPDDAPRVLATVRGTFEGRIGVPPEVPRGSAGFGYDPLFLAGPDFARTAAQMAPAEKNARSHRGDAARQMGERIAALIGGV